MKNRFSIVSVIEEKETEVEVTRVNSTPLMYGLYFPLLPHLSRENKITIAKRLGEWKIEEGNWPTPKEVDDIGVAIDQYTSIHENDSE